MWTLTSSNRSNSSELILPAIFCLLSLRNFLSFLRRSLSRSVFSRSRSLTLTPFLMKLNIVVLAVKFRVQITTFLFCERIRIYCFSLAGEFSLFFTWFSSTAQLWNENRRRTTLKSLTHKQLKKTLFLFIAFESWRRRRVQFASKAHQTHKRMHNTHNHRHRCRQMPIYFFINIIFVFAEKSLHAAH